MAFELAARVRKPLGLPLSVARNRWFQSRVAGHLAALPAEMGTGIEAHAASPAPLRARGEAHPVSSQEGDSRPVVFSYSYTALAPFRVAKARGWRTVLGQIDPGPPEERIVAELRSRYPQYAGAWQPAPAEYWAAWREECSLADVVMVNSDWSQEALRAEGVPAEKIVVVPLAYDPPQAARTAPRVYPRAFSKQRPLRVLFLGQANIRKGIHDLVSAAERLRSEPVEFDVAGPHGPLPPSLPENLTFRGPVPRGDVGRWYRRADLFVLPTHSDGFALTQIEAMACGLPVVATPRCGTVVEPGRSGWIVEPGNPGQFAEAIREAVGDPQGLAEMSAAAVKRVEDFSIERLGHRLARLGESLVAATP
jgi:glycosyltransferase involved in cell wall biosynthesis